MHILTISHYHRCEYQAYNIGFLFIAALFVILHKIHFGVYISKFINVESMKNVCILRSNSQT